MHGVNDATTGELPKWVTERESNHSVQEAAVIYLSEFSPLFDWVGIYQLNGNKLTLGSFRGEPTEHTAIEVGQGVWGTAVAENRNQNVPDVRDRENYISCSLETRSELVVLVKNSDEQILGQIDIDSHTVNAFGDREELEVHRVAQILGELWNE